MNQTTHNQVREITVTEASAGQRIDNFLLKQLKGVPKSRIYRILRKGEVRVNKGRSKPEYRLQAGDTVRIPPIRVAERDSGTPHQGLLKQLEQRILYEDSGLLVLNKPSGVAVHGGSGISHGVIEGFRALRPQAHFLELAHRLDRDTSGVLVIAKKRSALRDFQERLRNNEVDKRYLALVKGRWKGGGRRIEAPLQKNVLRSGERVVRVAENGKAALSIFEPEQRFAEATLMRVKIVTGRTHQVRVHAKYSGHPIAGDEKYGDEAFNREMLGLGLRRLFLHAAELRFTPRDGTTVHVEAPLDEELLGVLRRLEGREHE